MPAQPRVTKVYATPGIFLIYMALRSILVYSQLNLGVINWIDKLDVHIKCINTIIQRASTCRSYWEEKRRRLCHYECKSVKLGKKYVRADGVQKMNRHSYKS